MRDWVLTLKYGGDKRLSLYPASMIFSKFNHVLADSVLVPVPPRRIKKFYQGNDHVYFIARALVNLGVSMENILTRHGNNTQKGLNRTQRISGRALNFRLSKTNLSATTRYVLLDDVTTTGSTLGHCASLLLEQGAMRVSAIVLCRD